MVCDDVLRIKNWPKELSKVEKEDFLRHFGATGMKVITSSSKQKSIAFAKFESKETAKSVMLRLHQVAILNSRLCVEFAENDITESTVSKQNLVEQEVQNKKKFKSFTSKLNALNSSVSFNQPPPPHLKYNYPNANRSTINNIAHALASVPKFYTQVLHLMNRMNLPPPFSDRPDPPKLRHHITPQTRLHRESPPVQPTLSVEKSSSESELESDPENMNKTEVIPKKRTLPQKKAVKRPKFIKPNVLQPTQSKTAGKVEDVFETTDIHLQKKIEFNVSSNTLEGLTSQPVETVGSFGIMQDAEKPPSPNVEAEAPSTESINSVITKEELASNQIPASDLSVVSAFKNYHPGSPTCRLYIKNISKMVEPKDLEYIYNRYREDCLDSDKPSQFDVRLMQEGKMKGQAFITLDSVQLAQKALTETNGYILKDKPLVVVFARSAVPKKQSSK